MEKIFWMTSERMQKNFRVISEVVQKNFRVTSERVQEIFRVISKITQKIFSLRTEKTKKRFASDHAMTKKIFWGRQETGKHVGKRLLLADFIAGKIFSQKACIFVSIVLIFILVPPDIKKTRGGRIL